MATMQIQPPGNARIQAWQYPPFHEHIHVYVCTCVVYIYIYIYVYTHIHVYIYTYIHIYISYTIVYHVILYYIII